MEQGRPFLIRVRSFFFLLHVAMLANTPIGIVIAIRTLSFFLDIGHIRDCAPIFRPQDGGIAVRAREGCIWVISPPEYIAPLYCDTDPEVDF